jgi:hypothetical protein
MKTNRWIPYTTASLALALMAASGAAANAQVTNLISDTTFETEPDGRARYTFTYSYAGNGDNSWSDPGGDREVIGEFGYPEDNPTNTVLRFTFDTSFYTPVPSGAWYGFGVGGGFNQTRFDVSNLSTNRADYVLTFEARAENLLPGTTTATGEFQVQLDTPDDTIQPPDSNGDADRVIQVNLPFEVGTNWTRFRLPLGEGGIGGGSERNLMLYSSSIDSVAFNVNFPNPGDDFGFDPGNLVYMDNVRLEVISRPASTNEPPLVGIPIVDWNFDNKPTDYNYEYNWSANEVMPVFTGSREAVGYGVGGTNAWILQMDNTELGNNPPAWAGGGTGGGGAVDFTAFTSPDLAAYRISFDARVEGLAPEKTDTTTVLQLFLDVPDDTLLPADENTDADQLLRLDFQITGVYSNFEHRAFLLSVGSAGNNTSKTNFPPYHSLINGLRTQWQIENAASINDWGYDADNALVIDNVKLERLETATSNQTPITIQIDSNGLTLTWTGNSKLQSSTSVTGPFAEVQNASSPYNTTATGTARFFRLVSPTQ